MLANPFPILIFSKYRDTELNCDHEDFQPYTAGLKRLRNALCWRAIPNDGELIYSDSDNIIRFTAIVAL